MYIDIILQSYFLDIHLQCYKIIPQIPLDYTQSVNAHKAWSYEWYDFKKIYTCPYLLRDDGLLFIVISF